MSSKKILHSQDGVAILMVMTTIALLAFIIAEFTFDTKVNKLKVYNIQDREQARLNAESGLKFALAKLKVYKEGFNLLQKNENAKSMFPQSKLESVITQPFMFPIPIAKSANLIQKNAVEEFTKNTLIRGSLFVEVSQVSGFLNPNGLILPAQSETQNASNQDETPPQAFAEKQFIDTLTKSWEQKKEGDEEFNALYGNLNINNLVSELKFYVNKKSALAGQDQSDIENPYNEKNVTPKHAPMSSLSEMSLLQGWDDAIVDLIRDRLTVHETAIIPLNQITKEQLRLIFSSISDEQLTEFFKYRDGTPGSKNEEASDPHPFDSEADFKNLIVNQLNVLGEALYSERIKELEKAGFYLGVAGKLFKVVSKGEYGRALYTITAYIDLPLKPDDKAKKKKNNSAPTVAEDEQAESSTATTTTTPTSNSTPDQNKRVLELLEPRIVEIQTN